MTDRVYQLLGQQALRIAELEAEIAQLKGEEAAVPVTEHVELKVGVADNHADVDQSTYEQLAVQHSLLQLQHARCGEQIAKANRRYAQAKEKVMEWHAYINQQSSRKRTRGFTVHEDHVPIAIGSINTRPVLPRVSAHPTTLHDQPLTPDSDLRTSRPSANDENVAPPSRSLPISSGSGKSSKPLVQFGSSQSTVLEPDDIGHDADKKRADEDHEDTVTISLSRSKRRQVDKSPPVRIKTEPGTPQQPVLVSSDDRKDSVTRPSMRKRSEASDLDASHQSAKRRRTNQQPPQHDPLRSLPLKDMKMSSFKPNPSFEGPYLRLIDPNIDTARRRCPPGCKRVECCGDKTRKMLELGGHQVSGKTDAEALQEYLGPGWRALMATYGASRRKEIISLAHATSFANTTHTRKTRGDRPNTPPGFWRMNMPSTQEIKDEDGRVEEMKRRTIEERWHEARRANGRWLFVDE